MSGSLEHLEQVQVDCTRAASSFRGCIKPPPASTHRRRPPRGRWVGKGSRPYEGERHRLILETALRVQHIGPASAAPPHDRTKRRRLQCKPILGCSLKLNRIAGPPPTEANDCLGLAHSEPADRTHRWQASR